MTENELLDELMTYIETYRLSHVLNILAQRCASDRLELTVGGVTDPLAVNYLSDEENCLEAASVLMAEAERNAREKQKLESKPA